MCGYTEIQLERLQVTGGKQGERSIVASSGILFLAASLFRLDSSVLLCMVFRRIIRLLRFMD